MHLSNWYSNGFITEKLRFNIYLGHLQATFGKLLTYCVLRPNQPPTFGGMGNYCGLQGME